MTLAQLDPSAKAPWTNTTFLTVGAAAVSLAGRLPANNGVIAAVKMSPRGTSVLMIPRSNDVMWFIFGGLVDVLISPSSNLNIFRKIAAGLAALPSDSAAD